MQVLSSGEALIRNFLVGHQVCTAIGGKMNAGYIPDNFGHISQMPQISLWGGCSISAFFFRGCNIQYMLGRERIYLESAGWFQGVSRVYAARLLELKKLG